MDNEKKTGEEKIIDSFMKNGEDKIIVSFTTYKGKRLINLRVYYESENGWKPTAKGLTIRRELIPDLKAAIDKAAEEYLKELPGSEEPEKTEEEAMKEADIQKPEKDDMADIHTL